MSDHAERTAVLSGLDELARGLDYGQARTIRKYILAAEAEVARLREILKAKDDLLRAHRTSNHRLAEKALDRLAALAKEDTMTDHAVTPGGWGNPLAALDALVADNRALAKNAGIYLDRQRAAEEQAHNQQAAAIKQAKRAEAAEAERDAALRRLETTGVVELHERYQAVRDALLDLIEYACRMPEYSIHPQTERAREVFEETE